MQSELEKKSRTKHKINVHRNTEIGRQILKYNYIQTEMLRTLLHLFNFY